MKDGFLRIASAAPALRVADCDFNAAEIIALAEKAAAEGVKLLSFPELSVTGYTCQDLFLQRSLLEGAENALCRIAEATRSLDLFFTVGLPFRVNGKLYNAAAALCRGKILGILPKTHIPTYSEFYERRWFTPAPAGGCVTVRLPGGQECPFGARQLFRCETMPSLTVAVEICEDGWVTSPPSSDAALRGATVVLNLSASDEVIGKAEYRKTLFSALSARQLGVYVYCAAGRGESTTDLVFGGHQLIFENGALLSEAPPFGSGYASADADLERLLAERQRISTFVPLSPDGYTVSGFSLRPTVLSLQRSIPRLPFVPSDSARLAERCAMITAMQANGLAKRLVHTGLGAVLGISGGLDSTLALLVTVKAFDLLGKDRSGITCVTMPGFGTTSRTKNNAERLCHLLGVSLRTVSIVPAVRQHFADIGHDGVTPDLTFENSQARERTQILMDLAGSLGALVVGTGDLSELALGWATYNGDHISMYGVNASIPKTLVKHLVSYFAEEAKDAALRETLSDILATPVSPELLPPDEKGEIAQKTEEAVGPYELHDFFLYYVLRFGFSPSKIYRLALRAWEGRYGGETVLHWMRNFYRRFFSQQFKRSCLPDGPKVGTVTLSPRGDWRMPSDACAALWLSELDEIEKRETAE